MKRETLNGRIFICQSCQKIHLEFNSFAMDLKNRETLTEMLTFLKAVKATSSDELNESMPFRRKIMIPFSETNIKLLLTAEELEEIIQLIDGFIAQLKGEIPIGRQKNIPMKFFNGIPSFQLN